MSYFENHKWIVALISFSVIVAWLWWPSRRVTTHPGMKDAPRTTTVAGKVYVDGAPTEGLHIYLVPINGNIIPYAQCKNDGTFAMSTNVSGDGAPMGEYKVTMRWIEEGPQIGRQQPSQLDRFKGRYADPVTSAFKLAVGTSPIRDLNFELSAEKIHTGKAE